MQIPEVLRLTSDKVYLPGDECSAHSTRVAYMRPLPTQFSCHVDFLQANKRVTHSRIIVNFKLNTNFVSHQPYTPLHELRSKPFPNAYDDDSVAAGLQLRIGAPHGISNSGDQ